MDYLSKIIFNLFRNKFNLLKVKLIRTILYTFLSFYYFYSHARSTII